MGGSDNKGDGLASQPRRYRVPGQPLLNRHQVGGVSRSPDGLFAQQEWEPIRGRPAVRGKGAYGGRPGQRVEEGTWAAQKHSEAGDGRPVDRGVWTAKTVKRPRQQPAHPQYANYWAPLTRKRHTMPHPAQSQHANYWAPRTRKRHQQEHRPQRPTESSDPTQHAKGRTGDRSGPRKGATTRRNVTQGGGGGRLWGPVPVGGAPRVAGPCPPSLPAVRGPAHWAAGHRFGLRPRFPLLSASPLSRCAVPRGGGGGQGCSARSTRPRLPGGPGVRGRWGRRPGPAVSGQWSAGQRDSIAARVRAPRAAGARPPGGVPARQDRGLRLSPTCPAARTARGGGVPRVGGPGPAGGGAPGRRSAPTPPAPRVRRLGFEARPAGRRAIAFGFGRHLRLRLCGGWGCGGGGFLGR